MKSTRVISSAASGDVGLLSDENAQRLCSIFSESAWNCLLTLREMSQRHGPARFKDLYLAGLSCVRNWNADVVKEEVVRMQAQYPESDTIFQYVYVLLIKEVGDDTHSATTGTMFPSVEEAYHVFLCRLCASPDVCSNGEAFFLQPLLERRAVYIECFRNAMHDILRRRTGGRPALVTATQNGDTAAASREVDDTASHHTKASSFRDAVVVVARSREDDCNTKCVEVSNSPCFFEENEDGKTSCSALKSSV